MKNDENKSKNEALDLDALEQVVGGITLRTDDIYTCKLCGKTFTIKRELTWHLTHEH